MPTGVKIKDLAIGTGAVAETGKVVVIHYRSFLNRGEEISSTHTAGQPAHIHLGKRDAIAGLQKGIEGMREHGRRELEISPHLAYGEKGIPGKIPPNAVLRFEVELLEVRESTVVKPTDCPPGKQLVIGRAGESARGLPQWQFVVRETGEAGGFFRNCPPLGATWRHSGSKAFEVQLSGEQVAAIFEGVDELIADGKDSLLPVEVLWSDTSEKANNIPRDQKTNTLCIWFGLYERGSLINTFYLPESSPFLRGSTFYSLINQLIAPHLSDPPKRSL